MSNAAPVIPWMGGKRRLADKLIPLFPQHECYVEVFCGGAALFFQKRPAPVEVLNDINSDLACLYRVLTFHLEEFVRQFKWAISSRQVFEWEKMKRPETLTDIQRAARFYYLVKNAFGAKIVGQCFGVANSSKPRLNLLRLEEDLSEAHLRLSRVTIENLPYDQLIKRYDGKDVFFYIDPPYWDCENDYGKGLFTKEDFTQLRDVLSKCQGKWLVSINNVPQIRTLFEGFEFKEVQTSYSINNAKTASKPITELLIANYKLS